MSEIEGSTGLLRTLGGDRYEAALQGVPTCEAAVSGDNYVGIGVHRTARISAASQRRFHGVPFL
jgi:hypothetical protein